MADFETSCRKIPATQRCFVCLPGTTRRFGTCKAAAHASALVASVGQRGAVRRAGGGALVVGSNFDNLGCTTTQCAHRSGQVHITAEATAMLCMWDFLCPHCWQLVSALVSTQNIRTADRSRHNLRFKTAKPAPGLVPCFVLAGLELLLYLN